MTNDERFWYFFEEFSNQGLTIFDIECAYKNGKDILKKIEIISPFKDQKDIEYYLNPHKEVIKNVPFNIVGYKEQAYMTDNFEYNFIFKNDKWVNKMKPVSEHFKQYLISQNIYKQIAAKIPLNKAITNKHLFLIYSGSYCDDEKGYIECVIQGAMTTLMLTWRNTSGDINVYPSDTSFNSTSLIFEIPEFDPTAFIDYVKSLQKRPKFFKDLKLGFKIREKMYTFGEDYLEIKFEFLQKDKKNVEATIEKIKNFIEERLSASEIEEHMKEEYFRYFNFKDIKADSFTFDLDLGTGDIEELHNIFYMLDETNNIKSVNVTLV